MKKFIMVISILFSIFSAYSKIYITEREVYEGYETTITWDKPQTEEQKLLLQRIIKCFRASDPYYMVLIRKYNKLEDQATKNEETK